MGQRFSIYGQQNVFYRIAIRLLGSNTALKTTFPPNNDLMIEIVDYLHYCFGINKFGLRMINSTASLGIS